MSSLREQFHWLYKFLLVFMLWSNKSGCQFDFEFNQGPFKFNHIQKHLRNISQTSYGIFSLTLKMLIWQLYFSLRFVLNRALRNLIVGLRWQVLNQAKESKKEWNHFVKLWMIKTGIETRQWTSSEKVFVLLGFFLVDPFWADVCRSGPLRMTLKMLCLEIK